MANTVEYSWIVPTLDFNEYWLAMFHDLEGEL